MALVKGLALPSLIFVSLSSLGGSPFRNTHVFQECSEHVHSGPGIVCKVTRTTGRPGEGSVTSPLASEYAVSRPRTLGQEQP